MIFVKIKITLRLARKTIFTPTTINKNDYFVPNLQARVREYHRPYPTQALIAKLTTQITNQEDHCFGF